MVERKKKSRSEGRLFLTALVGSMVLLFVSCYPGDELTIADLDIVATFFSESADFSTKQTYSRPDFIFSLDDSSMQSGSEVTAVLERIDDEMTALGYTKTDMMTSDVMLTAFTNKSTWVGGSCYPSYYPYYYGWCYPVAYSYETGSFLIVMRDNADSTLSTEALWVAGINGALEGSTSASLTSRLNDGIAQAFEQSPYLGEGK
jgi:hypothetical protein